jgi:two-component sensor histidine kinase
MRILHVDDSPDDRALVARALRREWPEADLPQAGGPEALESVLAATRDLDVAILDFSLGWGDGLGVLRRIRAKYPDCPAILFTGSLGEERAVQMIQAGFDDYVIKSADQLSRLRASVSTCLSRREERRALARAEARHRNLFLNVGVGLFVCRPDGTLEDGNPALLRMLGLASIDELRRLNLLDLLASEEVRHRWLGIPPASLSGAEVVLRHPDGRTLCVQLDARAPEDEGGFIEGALTDVTALRSALEQKDTLLREVLHRVYNNLQQVDALLNLQGRRFTQPEIRQAFKEVGDRVRALALVQRKLHGGTDYQRVDFAAYLHDLAAAIGSMAGRPGIRIGVEAEPLALPIERAVPAGLIANELLTNALKHAFPGAQDGEIRVLLRAVADGQMLLSVSDNGVGLRSESVPSADGGLGTRLLPALARELRGSMVAEGHDEGFSVTVRFRP